MKFEDLKEAYTDDSLIKNKKNFIAGNKGTNTKITLEISKQILSDPEKIKKGSFRGYKNKVSNLLGVEATPTDVKNTAEFITSKNPSATANYAKKLSHGVRNYISKDVTKQSTDQSFTEKKTKEAAKVGREKIKKGKKNITLIRQGNLVSDAEGNVKDKDSFGKNEKISTKTSDAVLLIPSLTDNLGNSYKEQSFFVSFKTTNGEGGGQDNQKNDVKNTLNVIKGGLNKYNSLAVLDGDYYLGKNGKLKFGNNTSTLDGESYKDIDINIKGNILKCHKAMSLSQWLNLLSSISNLIYIDLKDFNKKPQKMKGFLKKRTTTTNVISESEGEYLLTEEELQGSEKFIQSLGNIQDAMKKQDMNTSVIDNIKNKFKNLVNLIKNKLSNIKNKFIDVKNKATYAVKKRLGKDNV